MYIFVNNGAKMSRGKLGAQTGHAAIDAYGESSQEMIDAWYVGHHTTKIVLHADDAQHLLHIERYLNDRGYATSLVIDEGRTEVGAFTPTALGVEIVDKDDPEVNAVFSQFQLLKDPKPEPTVFSETAKPDMKIDYSGLVKLGKELLDTELSVDQLLNLRNALK